MNLETAVSQYIAKKRLSKGSIDEYRATIRKWHSWGQDIAIEELSRTSIRDFLDWVHEKAILDEGSNPGRTANKARDHVRAVMSWAWENDLVETLPRFPKPKPQRDVAGRHYLTKADLNSIYFATYDMASPRDWCGPHSIGRYWRCALAMFFTYGVDTGTIWKTNSAHEPILWRHISWARESPDGQAKVQSRYGWIYYRRVKTGKTFYRPMNRVVHAHLRSIADDALDPDSDVFLGGAARPNARFKKLWQLASVKPKSDIETGETKPWLLKDLRKTCATYYDEHIPETSIEILGHSVGGVTYRHYAHRDPLAFKAIMTIPQPTAFTAIAKGFDGACPCCRRRFGGA
jgi:hypothetical protein